MTTVTPGVGQPAPNGGADAAPAPTALRGAVLRRQMVQFAPGVLLPALLSVASAAIFTRVFEASVYGRFSLAVSVAAVAILLASQWLQQGVTRFVPAAPDAQAARQLRAAIGLALLLVGAVTTVAALVAILLGAILVPSPWLRVLLGGVSFVLASVLFGPLNAILQSEMRARRYSAYIVLTGVLRLLASLALVFLVARDVSFLLWAPAAALALVLPALWRDAGFPSVRALLRQRRALWPDVHRLALYGFPVVGWTIAANLLDGSDRWFLQLFRGSREVGVYSANYSLVVGTIGLVAIPMALAAHPFLMRAWAADDRPASARWLGAIVEWYIIAGTLVVGIVGIYSRDIATLMLGPTFREGYRIIPIVLAGMVVWQLGMYSHKPLEFTERTGVMFALCVAATALNVALNLVVVPRFGYMGAACTSLVSYIAYTAIATVVGRRILPWTVRWRRVLTSLAWIGAGLLLTWLVREAVASRLGDGVGLLASIAIAVATVGVVVVREVLPMLRARAVAPSP